MRGEKGARLSDQERGRAGVGEDEGNTSAGMLIMVNFYEPGSLSISDYEVVMLRERGTINVRAIRQRFNIASAWLLHGQELEDDTEVLEHLNIGNDLDITGTLLWGCSGNENGEGSPTTGRACVLQ